MTDTGVALLLQDTMADSSMALSAYVTSFSHVGYDEPTCVQLFTKRNILADAFYGSIV
jgi:hypothetical protein